MEATGTLLFLFVILLVYQLYRWLKRPIDTVKSWGIPYEPVWPLIGHYTPNIGLSEQRCVHKYRAHQAYATILFRLPFMVLSDPWTVQQVTIKQFHNFRNRGVSAINPYPMNMSLFSLADDHWKHVRDTVSPAFSTGRIKAMFPNLRRAADCAIHYIQSLHPDTQPVDAKTFFKYFVINSIATSLFGMDVDAYSNPDHPFFQASLNTFNTSLTNPVLFLTVLFPEYINFFGSLGSAMVNTKVMRYFKTTVDYILASRRQTKDQYHDFLGVIADSEVKETDQTTTNFLGQVYNWSKKGLTRDEIFGQSVAFMAAGFEAGATTSRMLAYCLAKNTRCQEKLYQHIFDKIGTKEPDYECLNDMPYLDMCIHETLRLYPSNHSTERYCMETVKIGDLTIPKGTMVLIPFLALGTDPEVWENADQYVPERFAVKDKPYRSVPFGVGPRECIGRRLGWIEMKILFVKLLQLYKIVAVEKEPLRTRYMGFLTVDPPIKLQFIPRERNNQGSA